MVIFHSYVSLPEGNQHDFTEKNRNIWGFRPKSPSIFHGFGQTPEARSQLLHGPEGSPVGLAEKTDGDGSNQLAEIDRRCADRQWKNEPRAGVYQSVCVCVCKKG